MLALHPAKKLSFNRPINNGDLVIVYERHDIMKAVTVSEGSVLQNRFGVFKHSEWIGNLGFYYLDYIRDLFTY